MKNIEKIFLVRINSPILDKTEHPHHFYPPFLLKYLQALLEKEDKYQIKILDCYVHSIPFEKLLNLTFSWSPDVIVIFFTSLNADLALKYASLIKEKNKTIILLGVGPDITLNFHRYIGSCLDFILPGEIEKELLLLIRSVEEKGLESIQESYNYGNKREPVLVDDIDSLPFPRYSLDELSSYHFLYPIKMNKVLVWGHLLGARGCFHNCIFCSQNTRETFSKKLRIRSAVKVVDEIEYLLQIGANFISFADDDFSISKDNVYSICNEVRRRSLSFKWTAQARLDEVDFQLLKTMKDTGCSLLAFGVESGSERIIKILGKNESNIDWIQKAKSVFADCRKLGIATIALFIIGNPMETKEDVDKSIKLAEILKPDIIQVHYFTLYPGSKAYQQFKDKIKEGTVSRLYHYSEPLINISSMSLEELKRMQVDFYRKFLLRPHFICEHFIKYSPFYFYNKELFFILFRKAWRLLTNKKERYTNT